MRKEVFPYILVIVLFIAAVLLGRFFNWVDGSPCRYSQVNECSVIQP